MKTFATNAALALEVAGIAVIVVVAMVALGRGAWRTVRGRGAFHALRVELSRGILLGLEFLVGADIIHTVAVDLTYASVGALAGIVLIRTFLSFTLEVEISGRWPWQSGSTSRQADG